MGPARWLFVSRNFLLTSMNYVWANAFAVPLKTIGKRTSLSIAELVGGAFWVVYPRFFLGYQRVTLVYTL